DIEHCERETGDQPDLGVAEPELGLYRLDQHVHDDPVDEAAGADRGERRKRPRRRVAQPVAGRPRRSRFIGGKQWRRARWIWLSFDAPVAAAVAARVEV